MQRHSLATDFGKVEIQFYNGNTATVSTQNTGPLQVRGYDREFILRLHRWKDGKFHAGLEAEPKWQQANSLSPINDWDGTKFRGIPQKSAQAIIEAVELAVNRLDWYYPSIARAAAIEALEVELKQQYKQVIDLRDKLAATERSLNDGRRELKRLQDAQRAAIGTSVPKAS